MASEIWLRTILIVRKETRCRHIGYSFWLTARVLLYAPSHRQDSTYHGLCYTSRGALAGTRNSSMGSPHEGSIRRPIAPRANALTTELHLAPNIPSELLSSSSASVTLGLSVQWEGQCELHQHIWSYPFHLPRVAGCYSADQLRRPQRIRSQGRRVFGPAQTICSILRTKTGSPLFFLEQLFLGYLCQLTITEVYSDKSCSWCSMLDHL